MTGERRGALRRATCDHVRFELRSVAHSGAMRNLSQLGCMIEAPGLQALVGERVTVKLLPDYPASGRIAWRLGDAVGISFHQPVPIQLVRQFALDDWSLRSPRAKYAPSDPVHRSHTIDV